MEFKTTIQKIRQSLPISHISSDKSQNSNWEYRTYNKDSVYIQINNLNDEDSSLNSEDVNSELDFEIITVPPTPELENQIINSII
jgi:hypothetical protein